MFIIKFSIGLFLEKPNYAFCIARESLVTSLRCIRIELYSASVLPRSSNFTIHVCECVCVCVLGLVYVRVMICTYGRLGRILIGEAGKKPKKRNLLDKFEPQRSLL